MTRRLDEFASNAANRSWPVSEHRNTTLWTMTLHEPTCRFAKRQPSGNVDRVHIFSPHYGQEYLELLRNRGVDGPKANVDRVAWNGCKVCGTASIPREEWAAMVDAQRAEWTEAARRDREEWAAKKAREDAQKERDRFISDAEAAVYDAEFRAMIEARLSEVRLRAGVDWTVNNPEAAALLKEDHA